MAGYLINLGSEDSLEHCITNGIYSTIIKQPRNNRWARPHESTFADYVTMNEGDNIYFFIKRKIYGIGDLVGIGDKKQCKFENYPGASTPIKQDYARIKNKLLHDTGKDSINQRWCCTFRPSPFFFRKGIDMDELLQSRPSAFKMLRVFWNVSFIKFGDEENQAIKDAIIKTNAEVLTAPKVKANTIFQSSWKDTHREITKRIEKDDYNLKAGAILKNCTVSGEVRHEMAIEAALLSFLANKDSKTTAVFGEWDYLSHQVIASPFKPIEYMDRMDIFGYSRVGGFKNTIRYYLIIEIKKGEVKTEDVDQLMKYVDWVRTEYCSNDYSMIKAFLVGLTFDGKIREYVINCAKRYFTVGSRPAESREWNDLVLVRYSISKGEINILKI